MHDLKEQVKALSEQYFEDTVAIRRHLHQYPELSGQEFNTAGFIAEMLNRYGIKTNMYLDNTAVVALIEGKKATGKVIALRADMDALPIEEKNNLDYQSSNKGVMHACGHDAHMASLITTARILQELTEKWTGTVKLIFQPSEEKFPGGAIQLIEAGALEDPKVDAVLGLHVSPEIETGKIGMKPGDYMASTDEIYITVIGKGGHAAIPEMFINPLLIASKLLLELNAVYSEKAPKDRPSVLTFGRILGEGKTNIVPDEVRMEGTLRTFDETWRKKAHQLIVNIAQRVTKEMGGNAQVRIDKGYPVLTNNDALTCNAMAVARDFCGAENVLRLDYRMTAEDFAYYSRRVPSVFYRLGTGIDGYDINLHSSEFRINEQSLRMSPALMSYLAIKLMRDL